MAYTEYLDQVQKAYLAYYQRPADPAGQVYWAQRLEAANGNLDGLMSSFAHSEESGRLYGDINNDTIGNVIDAFYQAMFHRAAEAEGKAYYVEGFKSGKFSAGSIALDIINGAQNDDAVSIMNKMAAANFFTQAIDPDMNGEPPYMMTYNTADEKAARDWLHTITFESETRKTQSQVITDMKNLIANAGDPIFDVAEGFVLTNDTDVAISNIFTAGLVYTPGGDDRINSLQDEDILTGTGTNPTLNATLGNANDNGATVITPKLVGIETINVAFTGSDATLWGSAVTDLDLQDATGVKHVNITRVSQATNTARIENIKQVLESMGVAKSNANEAGAVEFSFGAGILRGENTADLNLADVQIGAINIGRNTSGVGAFGVRDEGYEHLNIKSTGADNVVGVMNLPMDTGTNGSILISGDKNLTLATTDETFWGTLAEAFRYGGGIQGNFGRLATVDASALDASFELNIAQGMLTTGKADTSGQLHNVTITGSKNDDIFYLQDAVEADDVIDGGAGTDTLIVNGPTNIVGKVNNVENLEIRTGHDNNVVGDAVTIDADAFDSLASIYVRNEGQILAAGVWTSAAEGMAVTLNNLTSAQANGVKLAHGTTGNSDILNNILNLNLKVASGTADTATVTIVDGVNQDPVFNADIRAIGVEQFTIQDNDTESNTVHLFQGNISLPGATLGAGQYAQTGSTIALKGGQAGKYMNLDSTPNGALGVAWVTDVPGFDYVQNMGYGFRDDGSQQDNTTHLDRESAQRVAGGGFAARDAAVDSVFYGTVGAAGDGVTRHRVENLDAANYASDVIIRLGDLTRADGVSSMSLKTGSGNDTFIFDAIGTVNAGFTSGDTIAAGSGTDTLVIDGNSATLPGTPRISHQTSEWDNLTGIDVLRFGSNGPGYYARIDNDFISQTDNGNRLVVINNDGDLDRNTESNLELDLRGLSQNKWVTFIGANGNGLPGISVNRVVVDDISANQNMILDGGDTDVRAFTTPGYVAGNNNFYEVRNTAHISISDLSQTKNFSTILFTNDKAEIQTMTLQLNSTVVDALADSSHTATNAEREALTIRAIDNPLVAGAFSVLDVDASAVGSQFSLTIIGNGGDDTIISGQGADTITGGLGANNFVYTAAGQSLAGSMDTITDFVTTVDTIDVSAVLGGGGVAPLAITAAAAALTGIGGEFAGNRIAFFDNGVDTTVYVDVDNNNAYSIGDMVIFLQGVTGGAAPVAGDFLV